MPSIRAALGIATALLGAVCRSALAQTEAQGPQLPQPPKPPPVPCMVVGHVFGQDGGPFRDAEVWATAPDKPDVVLRRARADGEGMFVLGKLAAPLLVWARAPSMTTTRVTAVPFADSDTLAVDLRLWEARTLRGRILDPEGKPIAGASVVASKDFASFEYVPPEGTTDAQGRFELRGVPIGECCLRAIAPGFAFNGHVFDDVFDERIDLVLPRHDGIPVRIEVPGLPAAAAAATEVRLQATSIEGTYRMPRLVEQQRLAADGTCTVKGLPEATWTVTLQHPEFRFSPPTRRIVAGKAAEPVRFTAMPGSSDPGAAEQLRLLRIQRAARIAVTAGGDPQDSIEVRGRVLDARGLAVPYATVDVQIDLQVRRAPGALTPTWAANLNTRSSADGSFTLPGLPRIAVPMRLRALGANAAGLSEALAIGEGQVIEQDVTMGPASRVEGRLLDSFGEAVPGASVRLSGAGTFTSVMTDHQGRFVFVGLAPGSYMLTALHRRSWQFTDQPPFAVLAGETVQRELVLQ